MNTLECVAVPKSDTVQMGPMRGDLFAGVMVTSYWSDKVTLCLGGDFLLRESLILMAAV